MKRRARLWALGGGAGLLILGMILLPLWHHRQAQARQQGMLQSKLTNAAGISKEFSPPKNHLLIKPESIASSSDGLSVSLGGNFWYNLKSDGMVLPYDPQVHQQLLVASGHRRCRIKLDAQVKTKQQLTVSVSGAPNIQSLLFIENAKAFQRISTPASNATSLQVLPETPGVHAELAGDQVILSFDANLLQHHFFSFRMLLENDHGTALCTVALLPQNQVEMYIPIYTAADLDRIRYKLNGRYKLMNDISLSKASWTPIGSSQQPFTGIFDGGGFAVTGFYCEEGASRIVDNGFSLFGACHHAVIKNLRILSPQIDGYWVYPEHFNAAALATSASHCLIENCAVFGGTISTQKGSTAGIVVSTSDCVLLQLFNSATIEGKMPGKMMQNTGGIAATMDGYMAYCSNEGSVSASHLIGGLFGFGPQIAVSRCINVGTITGAVFIGEYPPGAFFQTMGNYYLCDCIFTKGCAGRAGSVFESGTLSGIHAIEPSELKNPSFLSVLGDLDGEDALWLLDDPDTAGPLPRGIRTLDEYRPGGDDP